MKKILFAFLLVAITTPSFSQNLNIQAGISSSSLGWKLGSTKILNDRITNFYGSIGLDYLKIKYFNLSTNVGYVTKGGASKAEFTDGSGNFLYSKKVKAKLNYITLNTEAIVKYPINRVTPFIAVGPRADFLISADNLQKKFFKNVSYGLITGIGVKYKVIKILTLGVRASYLVNFNDVSKNGVIKDHTLLINLVAGIKLL